MLGSKHAKNVRLLAWLRLPVTLVVVLLALSACGQTVAPVPEQVPDEAPAAAAPEEADDPILPTPTPIAAAQGDTAGSAAAEQVQPVQLDQLAIELEPVVTQLDEPLYVTHAGDGSGRLFIVEKAGTIRIFQDGQVLAGPFLDIRDRVDSGGSELGLLGLAFPPDFVQTGYFFVNYTGRDRNTHVSRFAASAEDANTADAGSELTVLQFAQPAGNHNGGMLAFGPDGYLYIGTGDGGAAFDRFENGQNPATLLGKMLRIDVTSDPSVPYTIPADNPWVDSDLDGADVLDEIWAIGLRNPWRYSFDRQTGDLWIADVGQNQYEEINLTESGSPGGLNYGWPIQEASHCLQNGCDTTGLVQPILEYSHAGGHCSVTGGYVYRGSQLPELDGIYFFGDYCSGSMWAAAPDGNAGWQSAPVYEADAQISSFGEDEAGELYMTDLGGGVVYRITLAE